jgi:hypothetical protein
MAQLSSNTLAYSQVFLKIREYLISDARGDYRSIEERTNAYNKLLQDLYENVSRPLTELQPLIKGEPPISAKINDFSSGLANDINVISKQVDFLNAKTVSIFNLFTQEIANEKKYSERIASKAKILQMYSKSPSNDLVYYGDTFDNMDKVDISKIRNGWTPNIAGGQCTLPISKTKPVKPTTVYMQRDMGFFGNNHQIKQGLSSDGSSVYRYVFEDTPLIGQLSAVGDTNPLTVFELEVLHLDKTKKLVDNEWQSVTSSFAPYEFFYRKTEPNTTGSSNTTYVDWSNHDPSIPLSSTLVMEYAGQIVNCLEITPYFESAKSVRINKVKLTKSDGSIIENVLEKTIVIGSSFVPSNRDLADQYFYNQATIRFAEARINKAEIFFENSIYDNITIGHSYWKVAYPSGTLNNTPFQNMERFDPDKLSRDIYQSVEYDESLLIPRSTNPTEFKLNGLTRSIPVKVVTKPRKVSYLAITLDTRRPNSTETKKAYFFEFGSQQATPNNNLNIAFEPRYNPEGIAINVKRYPSREVARVDLNRMKAVYEVATPPLVTSNGQSYIFSNFKIEKIEYTIPSNQTNYTVPVVSQVEIYNAKRMAIGLRDVSFRYEMYNNQAEIVSKPFLFDKNVDALMLSVETNKNQLTEGDVAFNYYVSLNESPWFSISPIQLDNRGVAEVLAFNLNLEETSKLPGVAYLNHPTIAKRIDSIVVKIEFGKSRAYNITPSIYSYELIAKVEV